MKIYDITLPIASDLAVWPGDTSFQVAWNCRLREGASVNLSAITLSVHTGTHADAPYHFQEQGATIEELKPEIYIGPAQVTDVRGKALIRRADLEHLDLRDTPRLLLRTGGWEETSRFPECIPVLAPDVPPFLGAQGVVLLGVDVPSVDAMDSKDLPNHHALATYHIHILESLRLAGVPEGRYELIALPLRLMGVDGSPVRAILRTLPEPLP